MQRRLAVCLVSCLFTLLACSSHHTPAPVEILNSQPELPISEFEADTYKVQAGDTLFAIAWYSGNDYRDIARWNGLPEPYTIQIGQTLRLRKPEPVVMPKRSAPQSKGPTISKTSKKRVEYLNKQAYGENSKAVSDQKVTARKTAKTGSFPARVARWVWPVKGEILESYRQTGDVNKGIDIQAEQGTPVVSAAAGKVVYTGNALRGYGNLVIIKHTESFLSAYAHNEDILVKERQWVTAGEQIATVGSSGTNLVKLHFEVRYRGKSLDPIRYLPSLKQ